MKQNAEHLSEALGQRIRVIRAARGLNQKDFGALGGVGLTTQQQYEAARTAPSTEYFFRLAEHGIEIPLFELVPAREVGAAVADEIRRSLARGAAPVLDEDTVAIEEIDLAYGLGGTYADAPVEVVHHRFPRAWMESITKVAPAKLTFARGRGDSMQPTIQDGDLILIDRSQRAVREWDAIWALTIGDLAMVKRLRAIGEKVTILSDSKDVPAADVHVDEINIVGRVIFIGRKV